MEFICSDTATRRLLDEARHLGSTGLALLVTGETGTGKEVLAREMHRHGRGGPFVVADCSVLSGETARSELFGAARGSYTGAHSDRQGLVEVANGGTLFLDELGEADCQLQKMLLRFLQSGEYNRVGDPHSRSSAVRVIAATNKDLKQEMAANRFRRDLYHRICVGSLSIPPLRERPDDILSLFSHFSRRYSSQSEIQIEMTRDLRRALLSYSWPGNVRELENVVALLTAGGSWSCSEENEREDWMDLPFRDARRAAEEDAMREYLTARLRASEGNVSEASRSAGIGRQYFQAWLRRVGIEAKAFRSSRSGSVTV